MVVRRILLTIIIVLLVFSMVLQFNAALGLFGPYLPKASLFTAGRRSAIRLEISSIEHTTTAPTLKALSGKRICGTGSLMLLSVFLIPVFCRNRRGRQ